MTETPVGVVPSTCRKARGCPGPVASSQTVPKPISSVPRGNNVDGQSGPLGTSAGQPKSMGMPKGSGPAALGPSSCRPPGDPQEDNVVCKRKCGCMRTSDKLKQILQTFPNPQPPECLQAYMAKKYDKASGYGYGQNGTTCGKVQSKDAELSETAVNDNMDPCHRCMLYRRRMRQAAEAAREPAPPKQDAFWRLCAGIASVRYLLVFHKIENQKHLQRYTCKARSSCKQEVLSGGLLLPKKCKQMEPVEEKTNTSRSWQIVSELVSLVQLSVTATALALYYLIYCYMQLVYYTLRSALYFHNADGPMKITIGVVMLTSLIVGFNILMRMEGIIGIVY